MNALNTKFKSVKMAWDSITFPLLQGTPIGADGTIQNDEDAIGLVMTTLTEKSLLPNIDILVAGDVEAKEIVYNSPTGLSDDAYSAMPNVWIYNSDGTVKKKISSGSGAKLFTVIATTDDGDVTTKYPFEAGMNWGAFVESQYNPLTSASGYRVFSLNGDEEVCMVSPAGQLYDGTAYAESSHLISDSITYTADIT